MLSLAEATWASILLDALANGSIALGRVAVDLPYLSFALPAFVAVNAAVVLGGRRGGRHRLRLLCLALVAIVGAGLTAGVVAGLGSHESLWYLATHSWELGGVGRASKWAWTVAIIAWGRGIWLGLSPPPPRQASASIVVGAVVFLVIFGERLLTHSAAYAHATASAGWLLFLFFFVGITAAAWLHERAVERSILRSAPSWPSGAWLLVLVVPIALVALLALLIAGAGGPVSAGLTDAGRPVVRVVIWFLDLIPGISIHGSVSGFKVNLQGAQAPPRHYKLSHTALLIGLGTVLDVLVAIAVLAVVAFMVHWVLSVGRRKRVVEEVADQDQESIFSWERLATHLRATIRRLLAHLRRPHRPSAGVEAQLATADTYRGDDDSARAAYRRLLGAARSAGHGREPTETTRELEVRLGVALPGTLDDQLLATLTGIYDRARYGEAEPSDDERAAAATAADAMVAALSSMRTLSPASGNSQTATPAPPRRSTT